MGFPPRPIPGKRPARSNATPPPSPPPLPCSTGSSVEHGYRVQIRDNSFNTHRPVALYDGIVGPSWRYMEFVKGNNPAGVPTPPYGYLDHHNLLTFQGAMALAWTTLAQNHHRNLECRLVKFRLIVEHKLVRQGVCHVPKGIGGDAIESMRGTAVDETIKMEDEP